MIKHFKCDNLNLKLKDGFILFIYPVYPDSLENKYDSQKCKQIIRVVAVVEIILAFLVQTTFR